MVKDVVIIIGRFLLAIFLLLITFPVSANTALVLGIDGAIGPATSEYFDYGLKQAEQQHANLVILQLDTPGGLDRSMRDIIKKIIASPIPIVTYVSPSGARAASAGTYILYASHIAAMAPGTNLGAATPVAFKGMTTSGENNKSKAAEEDKVRNDAMAYLRSLAQLHNRNVAWATLAVSKSASLPAQEALKMGVIDIVAKNIPDLLQQINGKTVEILNQSQQLHTKDLIIQEVLPDWRTRLLATITEPNVAYFLLLIGIYGLFFEFVNPGFILPGVMGGIAFLLALYALQLLPINYAGLGLIFLGIIFFLGELFMPSGVLAIGGVIAFVSGSIMLFGTQGLFAISSQLIIVMTVINIIFFLLLITLVLKSRRRKVVSGQEALIGKTGEITESGWVRIQGELWRVKSPLSLQAHQKVRIVGIKGLELEVEPLERTP